MEYGDKIKAGEMIDLYFNGFIPGKVANFVVTAAGAVQTRLNTRYAIREPGEYLVVGNINRLGSGVDVNVSVAGLAPDGNPRTLTGQIAASAAPFTGSYLADGNGDHQPLRPPFVMSIGGAEGAIGDAFEVWTCPHNRAEQYEIVAGAEGFDVGSQENLENVFTGYDVDHTINLRAELTGTVTAKWIAENYNLSKWRGANLTMQGRVNFEGSGRIDSEYLVLGARLSGGLTAPESGFITQPSDMTFKRAFGVNHNVPIA